MNEDIDQLIAAIGPRIRALRLTRRWSVKQLATKSGIPYQTIIDIERSRVASPGIKPLACLARTLGVTLDALVLGDATIPTNATDEDVAALYNALPEWGRQLAAQLLRALDKQR